MQMYSGKYLEHYKKSSLEIDPAWNKRYFTARVEQHLKGCTEKVLVVSGLRGTGKTVGILQAADTFDALYVTAQKDEVQTVADYVDLLKETDKKYIIIDEYGWIRDRRYL